jgi:protein TonB
MKAIRKLMLTAIAMLIMAGVTDSVFAQEECKKAKFGENVFIVVEDMPKFQNGDIKDFQSWVMKNIEYPKEALKKKISGKVYCQFVVAKDGKIKDIKILRSVDKLLDDEVIRVIKSSPKWTPGMQRNKAVDVGMTIPVQFKLS